MEASRLARNCPNLSTIFLPAGRAFIMSFVELIIFSHVSQSSPSSCPISVNTCDRMAKLLSSSASKVLPEIRSLIMS